MTRGDRLLIILLVVSIVVSFAIIRLPVQATGGEQVVIEVRNLEVERFTLTHSPESLIVPVDLDRGTAYVEIKEGRVRVLEMPDYLCPLHICSNTGWISSSGQAIVCMPNRMVVSIVGGGHTREVDVWS